MLCVLKRERGVGWLERNMVWVRWALEDFFLSMRGIVVPLWEWNRFLRVLAMVRQIGQNIHERHQTLYVACP